MSLPPPYYQDAACTIYHGDCMEILPHLDAVDHVITDPPYSERTHKGARTGDISGFLITFAHIEFETLRDLLNSIRVERWVVLTTDSSHAASMLLNPPSRLEFVRLGIWVKPNPTPQFTGDRPGQGFEQVAILHPPGKKRWNGGGFSAVWTFNKIIGRHPTEKPLELFSKFIEQFTDAGDTILDPFMGSGTTLEAAKLQGRKAIGIEREERYCEIAANRLRQEVLF